MSKYGKIQAKVVDKKRQDSTKCGMMKKGLPISRKIVYNTFHHVSIVRLNSQFCSNRLQQFLWRSDL